MDIDEIIEMSELADTYADTKLGLEYHPDWHDVRDVYFARLVAKKQREIDVGIVERAYIEHMTISGLAAAILAQED